MVRAVKTKAPRSLAKGQRALLLPGATTAEPWEAWVFAGKGAPELVQVCASPLDNKLRKSSTLALPVAQVFCLPVWLNETDPKQLSSIIPLQLEMRHLQPRGNDAAVFDYSVVAQEETRTLVVVGVLPGSLPADLHAEAYESFDLSVRCLPLPPNAMTLWREQDRINLAITRGTSLVYYQALTDNTINTRVVQDLSSVLATLRMQDVVAQVQRIVVWMQITPTELATLKSAIKTPVHAEERPAPVSPEQSWKLTPSVVAEARRARESQRWLRRGLLVFLVLYLLGVGWLITNYVLTTLRVADLRKWQTANADQLDQIEQGRAAWKELGPVVDTNNYPLELLFHASVSIPADQLHLTLFETNGNHILIKGEAKNVAGAFEFISKLKADPFFSGYTLVMGNPRPLPNDLASFQIDANRATSN